MKILKTAMGVSVLSVFLACGGQLVEFGAASNTDSGTGGGVGGGTGGGSGSDGGLDGGDPFITPAVIATTPTNGALDVGSGISPTARFNTRMDSATFTAATVSLKGATTVVPASIVLVGDTLTIDPTAPLQSSTFYVVTIGAGVKSATGRSMATTVSWNFTTEPAPRVVTKNPAADATKVGLDVSPTATFSQVMNPATINASTFTLSQAGTVVTGAVSYAGLKATFNPTANLLANKEYTVTITTDATSLAGTPLVSAVSWSFTTEAAPTVISTTPAPNATMVQTNVSATATFSTAMNPATINATSFTLKQGVTLVPAVVTSLGNTATINPNANLTTGLLYTATISTAVTSAGGAPMAMEYAWSFTPGASTIAPVVTTTCPLNGATNVAITTPICAVFSKAMDPTTLNATTFGVKQGLTIVAGTISYDGPPFTAYFTPASPLSVDLAYTATVTTGAKDTTGTPLAMSAIWSWNNAACSQLPIALASAGSFGVLAGSTITNTGPTLVLGDIGVSPGTAISGFLPGVVVGAKHPGDPAAAQAVADLTIAYNEAAGRVLCAVTVAGNLGGQTLAPGLYKSTSSLAISSGELTLDAQGDSSGVFIFQTASTLTVTSGRKVILAGGAQAKNVFWQIGTSATLGSTSVFIGTVMADQAITLETGATLEGRAMARIAAVTLDSNAVTVP